MFFFKSSLLAARLNKRVCMYNNWSEKDQLAHLQTSLTRGAAQCLWDVGPEKVKSLSALLDLLRLRFGSENQRERHRVELLTCRQRSGVTMRTV
jgi:hypothetical protein